MIVGEMIVDEIIRTQRERAYICIKSGSNSTNVYLHMHTIKREINQIDEKLDIGSPTLQGVSLYYVPTPVSALCFRDSE